MREPPEAQAHLNRRASHKDTPTAPLAQWRKMPLLRLHQNTKIRQKTEQALRTALPL